MFEGKNGRTFRAFTILLWEDDYRARLTAHSTAAVLAVPVAVV
jgi:hypothetical protein